MGVLVGGTKLPKHERHTAATCLLIFVYAAFDGRWAGRAVCTRRRLLRAGSPDTNTTESARTPEHLSQPGITPPLHNQNQPTRLLIQKRSIGHANCHFARLTISPTSLVLSLPRALSFAFQAIDVSSGAMSIGGMSSIKLWQTGMPVQRSEQNNRTKIASARGFTSAELHRQVRIDFSYSLL